MAKSIKLRVWTKIQIGDKTIEREVEIDNVEYWDFKRKIEFIETIFKSKTDE